MPLQELKPGDNDCVTWVRVVKIVSAPEEIPQYVMNLFARGLGGDA